MSEEKALVVVEQREVDFYGDYIVAVLSEEGKVFVPLRPICTALGVRWNAQYERIQRNPILSELIMSVRVTRTDIEPSSRAPRSTLMTALPLDYLNGWLFGIDANRVKLEIRDRVLQYQRECYAVLAQAFAHNQVTAAPRVVGFDVDELLRTGQDPEAQAYRMALAIANIARQQL